MLQIQVRAALHPSLQRVDGHGFYSDQHIDQLELYTAHFVPVLCFSGPDQHPLFQSKAARGVW